MIPARMASTRFFGKPLELVAGIPMVVYCAKNAEETGLGVYVCTDSKDIQTTCDSYNIKSILTPECATGTDRVNIAMNEIDSKFVINLQGDEPLLTSKLLNKIIEMIPVLVNFEDKIITGVEPIEDPSDVNDVKCAFVSENSFFGLKKIQYFSRHPISNYKQVGIYAMSKSNLKRFAHLTQGPLEKRERVELFRWIESASGDVLGCELNSNTISVDIPSDLKKVNLML